MDSFAAFAPKPLRFFLRHKQLHLTLLFVAVIGSVALMSLVLPNSSFAQEEKRAEREAAQRAKAEAAAKQQASPEASPQASPEAAGAVKDEKKEGEDDNKPKDPMSSP